MKQFLVIHRSQSLCEIYISFAPSADAVRDMLVGVFGKDENAVKIDWMYSIEEIEPRPFPSISLIHEDPL